MADSYDDFLLEQGGDGGGVATGGDDDSYEEYKRQKRQDALAKQRAAARQPAPPPTTPSGALNLAAIGMSPAPDAVVPSAGRLPMGPLVAQDVTATPAPKGMPAESFQPGVPFAQQVAQNTAAAGPLRSFARDVGETATDLGMGLVGLPFELAQHPVSTVEQLGKAAVTAPARALALPFALGEQASAAVSPVEGKEPPSIWGAAKTSIGGLFDAETLTAPLAGVGADVARGAARSIVEDAANTSRFNSALERAKGDAMAARARRNQPASTEPLALPPGQYDMGAATFQSRDVPETDPAKLLSARATGAGVPTEGPLATAPIGMPGIDFSPLEQAKQDMLRASSDRQARAGQPRALLPPSVEEQEGALRARETTDENIATRATPEDVDTYRLLREQGLGSDTRALGRSGPLPTESYPAFADRMINRQGLLDAAAEREAIQGESTDVADRQAKASGKYNSITTKGGALRGIEQFPKVTDEALFGHMADLVDDRLGTQRGNANAMQARRLDAVEAELESRGHTTDDIWTHGLERGRAFNEAAKTRGREGFTAAAPLSMILGAGTGAAVGAALAPPGDRGTGAAEGAVAALGLVGLGVSLARDGSVIESAASKAARAAEDARADAGYPSRTLPKRYSVGEGTPIEMGDVDSEFSGYNRRGALGDVHTKTPEFKEWFGDSKAAHDNGEPMVLYHGTSRADRLNPRLLKGRGTSGPMQFFTDDPDIASKYAEGKADTSLPDEERNYEAWFRAKVPGARKPVNIDRAWNFLSDEQRAKIKELAPRVTTDDSGENIILGGPENTTGNGGYHLEDREVRGNPLKGLVEAWLNSGSLYGEEARFHEVLKHAGVDVPIEMHDPVSGKAGVFPAHLSIQNPLVTSEIPESVVSALEEDAKGRRAPRQSMGSDPWDKSTRDPREWVKQLREDFAAGKNSFVWTSIPDWVTKKLKDLGYDGIKDTGGKLGGVGHDVWIPFEAEQVKSAISGRRRTGALGDIEKFRQSGDESTTQGESAEQFPHKYSSTQLNLPEATATKLKALGGTIADDDLAADGREDQPHITVKFGLHGNDPETVRALLKDQAPITVKLGKTSAFEGVENGTADAVKVDVDSPELHALNKKIGDAVPNGDTHPEYVPHATLAYVKPGLGEKYSGLDDLEGHEVAVDHLTFSGRDGKQIDIPLTGESVSNRRGAADQRLVRTVGAAGAGAAAGFISGDTPEEREKRAVFGLLAGGALGAVAGEGRALEAGEKAAIGAKETMKQPKASPKEAADAIVSTLAPQTRGELAAKTGEVLRARRGQIEREAAITQTTLDRVKGDSDKLPIGKKLALVDDIEHGRPQSDASRQPFANSLKRVLADERDKIREMGTGKLEQFIENYFPHLWQDEDKAGQWLTKILGKRPFEGSKSFLKQRTIPTVLEGMFPKEVPTDIASMSDTELLAESKRQGGLTPVTFNPVEATMLKLREMKKYRMAQEVMKDLTDRGMMIPIPEGGRIPRGYSSIGDWAFAGKAAPEPVARVLNNYLSPGLRGNAAYDAFMTVGNTLNRAQLGLSAFHAGMTTIEAMVSQNALALEKLFGGKAGEALKLFVTSPASPFTNLSKGNALLEAYHRAPGQLSGPMEAIANQVAEAGGRPRMTGFDDASRAFKNAMNAKQYGRAAKNFLPALAEKSTGLILNELVPRQKLGVFYDLAQSELERLGPEASQDAVRSAMQKAWDSVDNRLGSLVYDNLFWNKAMKDVMHASVRSVGWNWGTFRELGGGAKDLAGYFKDVAKKMTVGGEDAQLSHRAAYAMALPITVGLLGAVTQYLYTGKGPDTLYDYFHPKTGTKDADGNDNRVVLPSYMKDVYSYSEHPVRTLTNKANPLLTMMGDMLSNRNFYGDEIYNENDPIVKQLQQTAKFVGKEALPFAVQNVQESRARGESFAEMAPAFVGITPANREDVRTKAQNLMGDIQRRERPALTPEQQEATKARAELRDIVKKQGASAAVAEMHKRIAEGTLSEKQVRKMLEDDNTPRLVRQFKQLTLVDAEKIYAAGTPREKALWRGVLQQKRENANR